MTGNFDGGRGRDSSVTNNTFSVSHSTISLASSSSSGSNNGGSNSSISSTAVAVPTPTPTTASSRARNRANQAASRARTRARLAALEEQVARHDSAGMAAMVEIQRAGRMAADENARLRELISQLGVSAVQLAAWLERGELPTRPPPPPPPADDAQRRSTECGHAGRGGRSTYIGFHEVSTQRPGPCHNQKTERKEKGQEGRKGPREEEEETPGKNAEGQEKTATDETACADAAMIIASMRGGGQSEEIWSEMGCGPSRACVVKNSRIFDLAGSASKD